MIPALETYVVPSPPWGIHFKRITEHLRPVFVVDEIDPGGAIASAAGPGQLGIGDRLARLNELDRPGIDERTCTQ